MNSLYLRGKLKNIKGLICPKYALFRQIPSVKTVSDCQDSCRQSRQMSRMLQTFIIIIIVTTVNSVNTISTVATVATVNTFTTVTVTAVATATTVYMFSLLLYCSSQTCLFSSVQLDDQSRIRPKGGANTMTGLSGKCHEKTRP